jgi:hypothetical protein
MSGSTWVTDAAQAFLAAWGFGVSIAFGALFLVAITTTMHARWFVTVRPIASAIAGTLPLYLLLFVPVALLLPRLYPFAGATAVGGVATSPHLLEIVERQRAWNRAPFFVGRGFAYLVIASVVSELLVRAPPRLQVRIAAGSLPPLAFVLTFASFDWFMARSPGFASDAYGAVFFGGSFAAAAAVLALIVCLVPGSVPPGFGADLRQAVGKVAFVGVMLWGYLGFCQFLLVWIADLPGEIPFYGVRIVGAWLPVTVILGALHFAVPFLLLLLRPVKRGRRALAWVAGLMLVAHALDLEWLIIPTSRQPSPLDVLPFLVVAALAAVVIRLRLTPAKATEPEVALALRYESP